MTGPVKPPAALADVWAQIPSANCKGLCQDACGPIGASDLERTLVREASGIDLPDPMAGHVVSTCPVLGDDGGCQAYDARPTTCRLFAAVPELPCPHGCKPTFGLLPSREGRRLLGLSLRARS